MERAKQRFIDGATAAMAATPEIITVAEQTDVQQVTEVIEGSSLFNPCCICIIKDFYLLPVKRGAAKTANKEESTKKMKLTAAEEAFISLLENLDDNQYVLFYIKGSIEISKPFYKRLKDLAVITSYGAINNRSVLSYVDEYVKQNGRQLSSGSRAYLQELFLTWETVSLQFIYTELDKLFITAKKSQKTIQTTDLQHLFPDFMGKNLFTFTDCFFCRNSPSAMAFVPELFNTPSGFIKNMGYVLSQLRNLKLYKEMNQAGYTGVEHEEVFRRLNKGRNIQYLMKNMKKYDSYWQLREVNFLISAIYNLQLDMRRGLANMENVEALFSLYVVRSKGYRVL